MSNVENAKAFFLEGMTRLAGGDAEGAEEKFLQAQQMAPDRVSVLINLSATQIQLRKFEAARKTVRQGLALDPQQADLWLNLGVVEKAIGLAPSALAHFDQALKLQPDNAKAWFHKGVALLSLWLELEAEKCFARALQIEPNYPDAWLHRGALLCNMKRYADSLSAFNEVLRLRPDDAQAWVGLGGLHYAQGDLLQASQAYQQALVKDPASSQAICGLLLTFSDRKDHPAILQLEQAHAPVIEQSPLANELLGYHYFNIGQLERAHQCFKRATLASEAHLTVNNPLEWPISEARLRHDQEQLALLEARQRNTASGQAALQVLKKHAGARVFSAGDEAELKAAVSRYHHVPDMPFEGQALGANDFAAIEQQFLTQKTKLVVIDNFLSESALLALRQFAEEATVWKRAYANGYQGSFMASGFASRVILEIASQLKRAMPQVVGPHDLRQAWGFKYDQQLRGVNLHADFARVNINFWLTPDEACLDDTTGGLVVYDVPAPESWGAREYNADSERIQRFLDEHQAKSIRVPYRMNRCVLFDSTYFHTTDEIHFKEGYENRRVNCTLLFGKGL